ncbi:hypothetical protein K8I31_01920 [bacterium]|nr:hypothetical protein [bacterium]
MWELPNRSLDEEITFELQQSNSPEFSNSITRYKGPDAASFISGLPNGTYYYRVRCIDAKDAISGWSEPAVITIQHHSMLLAFSLFFIGMFVFAATVFVVVYGSRTKPTSE